MDLKTMTADRKILYRSQLFKNVHGHSVGTSQTPQCMAEHQNSALPSASLCSPAVL